MAVEARPHRNLIGGDWADATTGEAFESRDPATGDLIGTFPASAADDMDRAVAVIVELCRVWEEH